MFAGISMLTFVEFIVFAFSLCGMSIQWVKRKEQIRSAPEQGPKWDIAVDSSHMPTRETVTQHY